MGVSVSRDPPGPEQIARHFATDPDRDDVWKALDLFLDTEAYLNLGYSNWYQPHWLPSSQRRLVDVVGQHVREALPPKAEPRLLDIGSGRGGPAIRLAERWGFEVVGLDLVEANLTQATVNADNAGVSDSVAFVHGRAGQLPLGSGTVEACTAIDSLVYMADTQTVLGEAHRVLKSGGVIVLTDLVRRDREPNGRCRAVSGSTAARTADEDAPVHAFAREWDMPELTTRRELLADLERVGFDVQVEEDISDSSIRQFRRYSNTVLRLASGRGSVLLRALCDRLGLDEPTITTQVRAAHRAIPSLEHVLVVAQTPR